MPHTHTEVFSISLVFPSSRNFAHIFEHTNIFAILFIFTLAMDIHTLALGK